MPKEENGKKRTESLANFVSHWGTLLSVMGMGFVAAVWILTAIDKVENKIVDFKTEFNKDIADLGSELVKYHQQVIKIDDKTERLITNHDSLSDKVFKHQIDMKRHKNEQ